MAVIHSISFCNIYNSHVKPTYEFLIELDDGSKGMGGSPQGETISIYEDKTNISQPDMIIGAMQADGMLGKETDQRQFDTYLEGNISRFGRNNAYALSLAFFNATRNSRSIFELFDRKKGEVSIPRICFNVLNGGWHAYTNPVLSDFSEYMLVANSNDLDKTVGLHNELQHIVRERLLTQSKTVVSGNPVNSFKTSDNRECIDFLLGCCRIAGVEDHFELMIDASGTDLWKDQGYHLAITDQSVYQPEQFVEYWLDIIRQYNLRFLEDPFYELDTESWKTLAGQQKTSYLIGDNFYTSDANRIAIGAENGYTHGVIIKPNQAGTVSAVRRAMLTAKGAGQFIITSHRSISTESTFLSTLSCLDGAEYIKIGPLMTDYSSVIRLNELIRLQTL